MLRTTTTAFDKRQVSCANQGIEPFDFCITPRRPLLNAHYPQWLTMSPETHIAFTKQSQILLREWIGRVHKCLVWPDAEQATPRGRFSDINNSKLTALLNWRPRDEFLLMNTSGTRLPKRCNFSIKPALSQVSLCVVRSQLEGIFSTLRKSFTKLPP